jgi:hypothetical protein
MPTVKRQGVDRVSMSASIPSSAFDTCSGTPPPVVTFDVQIDATHVERTVRSETTQILKGEGTNSSESFKSLIGTGPVSGSLQGVEIVGFSSGFYETFSRILGGPTTTTLAP